MKYIFLLVFLLQIILKTNAQIPVACNGTAPGIACESVCISCNFDGYSGSTIGYPTSLATEFCGTVENAQWLGFIAGATDAVFTIIPSNCLNGDGVQVALYEDCTMPPLACEKGEQDGGLLPVSINVPLTPGRNYFLLIDGYAGDLCDFTVGVSPSSAVYQPSLDVVSEVIGSTAMCPGSTATFSVPDVYGASAFIWTGPSGTLFDTFPSPATFAYEEGRKVQVTIGDQGGQICVQAANTCSTNPPCSATLNISILDDSFRPNIVTDTVSSLACSGAPLVLEAEVQPLGTYAYAWKADSAAHIISADTSAVMIQVDSIGTYTLLVTNNSNGCTSELDIRVTPPNPPDSVVFELKTTTCYGDKDGSIEIKSIENGTPPFMFSVNNGGFYSSERMEGLEAGQYQIKIQAADGCEWDTVLMVEQPFELLLQLDPDTSIQLGDPVILWQSYHANYPERVAQVITDPIYLQGFACDTCAVYEPLNSFRYGVTILDSNGCRASDMRDIVVRKDRHVFIPNIFAPDQSSSSNSRFQVFAGDDVMRVENLKIADRWGQTVFERRQFLPDDQSAQWDGQWGNRPAPPGVYIYMAEVAFKDGEKVIFHGDVTVLR